MARLKCAVIVLVIAVTHQYVATESDNKYKYEVPNLESTLKEKNYPQQTEEEYQTNSRWNYIGVKPYKVQVDGNQETVFSTANNFISAEKTYAAYPDELFANDEDEYFKQLKYNKYYEAEEDEPKMMNTGCVECGEMSRPLEGFELTSPPELFTKEEREKLKATQTCHLLSKTKHVKDYTLVEENLDDIPRNLHTLYQVENTGEDGRSEFQTEVKMDGNEQGNVNVDDKMEEFLSQERFYKDSRETEGKKQTYDADFKHLTATSATEEKTGENAEFDDIAEKKKRKEARDAIFARLERIREIKKQRRPLFKDELDPEGPDYDFSFYFNPLGEEYERELLKYKNAIDENVEDVMKRENIPREEAERCIRIQKLKLKIFQKMAPSIYYHKNLNHVDAENEEEIGRSYFIDWSKENAQQEDGMDKTKTVEQHQDEVLDNTSTEKGTAKNSGEKVGNKNKYTPLYDEYEYEYEYDTNLNDEGDVDWESGKDFPEGAEQHHELGLKIDNVPEFIKWRIGRLTKTTGSTNLKYRSPPVEIDPKSFLRTTASQNEGRYPEDEDVYWKRKTALNRYELLTTAHRNLRERASKILSKESSMKFDN